MAKEEMAQPMEVDGHPSGDGDASAAATGAATTAAEEKDMMEDSEEEREMDYGNPAFSKFMQGFWDLASVDVAVRVGAAAMIVRHVSSADGDAAYAVRRLVRGVCSSRESARQGFASCLAQVLTEMPEDAPTTSSVLEQILQTTQTTSAMKGAEERDLILGRLLGVSTIAISGRLGSDPESSEKALKAVAELYGRRKWLAQAAGEAALLVISKAFEGEEDFTRVVLPILGPLLKGKDGSNLPLSDLSPDQLQLSLGLRAIMKERGLDPQEDSSLKQALPPFLRLASIVRLGKAKGLLAPLKLSASTFPKTHSVWSRLWDDIGLSPAGKPRASLSAKRLKRLGEVWSVVVDGVLASSSLNSKGTAILVLKQVLQRVPPAGVWHVLSPGIVRLMFNHTKGEENYLYSLVRMTLKQLPKIVGDNQEVQAQVAACLLRRGSIGFDSRVKMKVVGSLVESMTQEALDNHVEFLKGVARGKPGWADEPQDVNGEGSKPAHEMLAAEENPESSDGSSQERLQALEVIYSLSRTCGGDSSDGMQGQMERLSKTAEFFLEMGFFAPSDGATPLTPKMLNLCRSKFFGLVASIASKPLFWQATDKPTSTLTRNGEPNTEGAGRGALEALWGLHETWRGLEGRGDLLVEDVEIGDDEREACSVALRVVGRIRESSNSRTDADHKLGAAFAGILLVVSLHFLEGSKRDDRGQERCQHILDLVETYGRMSGSGDGGENDEKEDEDEGENDPDPLAMLADVLVAIITEPSTHSVKGLRDTARRVWGMVCSARPLSKSALETLLAAVCGDDESDAAAEAIDDDSSSEEEEEEESEGDEDELDDDEVEKGGGTGAEQSEKGGADGDVMEDGGEDDGEKDNKDHDEEMVDPSDLAELLGGDADVDDEGLQHHAGADAALGALLGLKKTGRKRGNLEAQRQGLQIRLRALDLLEVACLRRPHSPYLLGAILPVLKAIKALGKTASKGKRAIGEASALATRLQTLYRVRLCKCKPHVSDEPLTAQAPGAAGAPDDGLALETAQSFSQLMELCRAWQKAAPMSSSALDGALCCLRFLKGRPAKSGDAMIKGDELDGALKALVQAMTDFFDKRRGGGLIPAQVEEVAKRFPEVLVPVLIGAVKGAAASDFLRAEAFRLLSGILQRRSQMDPESRKALLAQCPAIFNALGDALREASAETTTAGAEDEQQQRNASEQDNPTDPGTKIKTNAAARSLNMLKAKRLKPLLGCLSATVSTDNDDGGGALKGMVSEVRDMRRALEAAGQACASLPMQLLCDRAAQELDGVKKGEATSAVHGPDGSSSADGEGENNEERRGNDSMSPGAKRKAEGAVKPADVDAREAGGEGKKAGGAKSRKSPKKKKPKKEGVV